ncbi:MAG: amidohydrolase family protein [Clostridia bacterium]|nr:amidohydrolase family protein [Clostridia bacterium]
MTDTGMESLTERECETLSIYGPAVKRFARYLKTFAEMGILIATGTDMTNHRVPTSPVDREAGLMVRYGMSPVWAIGASTLNCAKVLGLEDRLGELAAGKAADILVVEGDASGDIAALSRVKEVIQAGKTVRREI